MKKAFLFASFIFVVASGCGSSDGARRGGDDVLYPRRERVTRDPAVGRTSEGRTVYEDRDGRLYTTDSSGRRTYRNRDDVYSGRRASTRTESSDRDAKVKANRKPSTPPGHTANPSDRGQKVGHAKGKAQAGEQGGQGAKKQGGSGKSTGKGGGKKN